MKQQIDERSRVRHPRRRGVILTALACSVLLVACRAEAGPLTSDSRLRGHATTRESLSSSRSATNPSAPSPQVVTAWLAAEQAFETAARSSDPTEPALAATTVSPQIDWTRALLQRMRAADEIAQGAMRFGTPEVVALSSRLAKVTACGHDAEIVVSARNGQAVAGIAGQVDFEYFTSTMELTDSGWKLATQVVGVGTCDRS